MGLLEKMELQGRNYESDRSGAETGCDVRNFFPVKSVSGFDRVLSEAVKCWNRTNVVSAVRSCIYYPMSGKYGHNGRK